MQLDPTNKTCMSDLKLLGDYWTLRIVDVLGEESLRFCDLQRAVDNVNPVTLTSRLKRLEEAGLVFRTEGSEDGCSVTYDLTAQGKNALPVVAAIHDFTQKAAR